MFTYQKGILPFITNTLGILLPCIFFLGAISVLVPEFARSINSQPIDFVIEKTIKLLIGLLLYLILPFFFGIYLSGLFPAIRSTRDGLKYMYFGGLIKGKINWNEFDRQVELPWGALALIIDRPGTPLFNGLFMNALYGQSLRISEPVILLSLGTKNIDKLLQEITQKNSNISSQSDKLGL